MQGSTPQHYTIADFLKWHDDGELVLNPSFRGSVTDPAAGFFSLPHRLSSTARIPPFLNCFLRTNVDRDLKRTVRETS